MNIEQFTSEFELVRSQLKSYLLRMTAIIEDVEDIVQDTFIKASPKLDTFRGQSSPKTWIICHCRKGPIMASLCDKVRFLSRNIGNDNPKMELWFLLSSDENVQECDARKPNRNMKLVTPKKLIQF